MMNIKDLNVTVTYTVSLSELEIPDNIYNQIIESFYSLKKYSIGDTLK